MADIVIDARGLEPPGPFERVVDALTRLQPDDRVVLMLDREPRPLYRFLAENGYQYRVRWTEDPDPHCEIRIWE
jgi:TusA-related sulfurtransferase